jgi:outer membrane protein TolC
MIIRPFTAGVFCFLLAIPAMGSAQQASTPCPVLDLSAVRQRAGAASVVADAQELQADATLARGSADARWSGPMLSVGIAALPIQTRFGPAWAQVGFAQAIPALGSLRRAEAPAIAGARRLDAQAIETRLRDARDASLAWVNWQLADQMQELLHEQVANLQDINALSSDLLSTGAATPLDVLRTAGAIERVRFNALEWARRENEAASALARFLRCDVGQADSALLSDATIDTLPAVDELQTAAREAWPAVQVLQAQQQEELARVDAALDGGRPQFTVGAMWTTVGRRVNDMPEPRRGTDALMGTVTIAIPGPRRAAANERAESWEIASQATSLALENEHRRSTETVERIYADIRIDEQQLSLLNDSIIPLQQDQLDAVIDLLITGDVNPNDALEVTESLIASLAQQTQLNARISSQLIELDWWTGGAVFGRPDQGGAP